MISPSCRDTYATARTPARRPLDETRPITRARQSHPPLLHNSPRPHCCPSTRTAVVQSYLMVNVVSLRRSCHEPQQHREGCYPPCSPRRMSLSSHRAPPQITPAAADSSICPALSTRLLPVELLRRGCPCRESAASVRAAREASRAQEQQWKRRGTLSVKIGAWYDPVPVGSERATDSAGISFSWATA